MIERYPGATWRGDGQSGGTYTSGPFKVVLHTTETRTIPGYQSGATAPHVTYFPAGRYFVQHTSFATAARALRNESGGVQTNRDSVLQVEIVCYSARNIAEQVGGLWVGDLTDEQLRDLSEFLKWCNKNFNVALIWRNKMAYSYAEANASGYRMTLATWDAWNGVARHQDVPENTHWDTGALNMIRLMQLAREVPPPPPPSYVPPPPGYVRLPSGTFKPIANALATERLNTQRILENPGWYTVEQVYYATILNELWKRTA